MSYQATMKDIGTFLHPEHGSSGISAVAAGAGDNVEVNGTFSAVPTGAQSLAIVVIWSATLAENETLALTLNAQDAVDATGTGAADFKATAADGADGAGKYTLAAVVVATGGAGGTTAQGATTVRFPDIRSHRGFIRSQVTPNLSAGGVDTAELSVGMIFAGMESLPGDATNVTRNA